MPRFCVFRLHSSLLRPPPAPRASPQFKKHKELNKLKREMEGALQRLREFQGEKVAYGYLSQFTSPARGRPLNGLGQASHFVFSAPVYALLLSTPSSARVSYHGLLKFHCPWLRLLSSRNSAEAPEVLSSLWWRRIPAHRTIRCHPMASFHTWNVTIPETREK